ncbi:MAG: DNA repair protein RecO [Ruminococcaceae bacterium]|jgi:DNA repair protein RecO (recombination protein O)|nr:DNA repair protein RecO [Oscillospiraceae bacterium]
MEELEVDGLVIREVETGEADKMITLLTGERGRLSISGKGLSSIRHRYAASSQLFSYSTYLLKRRTKYWYIADAFYIDNFMELRYDVDKLALANYICDVAYEFAQEEIENRELMSLTLNTLYALAKKENLPEEQLRGAFEFRMAVQEGFMPDLSGCGVCGRDVSGEDSTLDVMNGRLLCKKCRTLTENDPASFGDETAKIFIRVSPSVLAALRFVESAPQKKFLSFALDKTELSLFSVVCERYFLNHVEHGFSSLEYYKKIRIKK